MSFNTHFKLVKFLCKVKVYLKNCFELSLQHHELRKRHSIDLVVFEQLDKNTLCLQSVFQYTFWLVLLETCHEILDANTDRSF